MQFVCHYTQAKTSQMSKDMWREELRAGGDDEVTGRGRVLGRGGMKPGH